MLIDCFALCIEVLLEELNGLLRKTHILCSALAAALVACLSGVFHASSVPIPDGQCHQFRYSRSRFKQQTNQAFFTQSPAFSLLFECSPPVQYLLWQIDISDDLGNP